MNSRIKGNDFELLVARTLKGWWNDEFRRTPLSGGWSSMASGDIIVPTNFPWCVECKHSKDFHVEHILRDSSYAYLRSWWEQTKREAIDAKKEPLLIVRGDRTIILCCVQQASKIKPLCQAYTCNSEMDVVWFRYDWLLTLSKELLIDTFRS